MLLQQGRGGQGDEGPGDPAPVRRAGVSGRLWGTFLPAEEPAADGTAPRGVSILARDMQSVAIYDSRGQFVGIRRPDSGRPISVRRLSRVGAACQACAHGCTAPHFGLIYWHHNLKYCLGAITVYRLPSFWRLTVRCGLE